ncbi:unnamed protein product [Owenia fusiformis]|uniref:Uncharacterized protein n=1 Tax=Owenia fusiformis TaxID=6347 RepID=A0A8J1UNR9_OWEFU|nr:unnamed protein product [Owenia fusiformis]
MATIAPTSTSLPPSDKKSPPRREKITSSKTPQSVKQETKNLKRKLFTPGSASEDEDKKQTPKRKKSVCMEGSLTPGQGTPKTGSGRLTVPLSERQQMALLMQMTAEKNAPEPSSTPTSPSHPMPASSIKKTPLEKRIHKRNERGETVLHLAAIRGDCKQTKKLIKAGADVNAKDFAGWTALHEACNHGWLDVAKALLRNGADVNVQGLENDTPLHDAAINGHIKLVRLLVRHGANPYQQNSKGTSPLDVAATSTIVKLLKGDVLTSSDSSDNSSPTSPESILSDKEEEKTESQDSESIGSPIHSQLQLDALGLATSTGAPRTFPHPQKSSPSSQEQSSPRLTLKFQHLKNKDREAAAVVPRKSYSVAYNEDKGEGLRIPSPAFSSSSQDSDLYNPRLNIDSGTDEKVNSTESKSKPASLLDFASAFNSFVGTGSTSKTEESATMEIPTTEASPSSNNKIRHILPNLDPKPSSTPAKQKDPYAFEDISDEEVKHLNKSKSRVAVDSSTDSYIPEHRIDRLKAKHIDRPVDRLHDRLLSDKGAFRVSGPVSATKQDKPEDKDRVSPPEATPSSSTDQSGITSSSLLTDTSIAKDKSLKRKEIPTGNIFKSEESNIFGEKEAKLSPRSDICKERERKSSPKLDLFRNSPRSDYSAGSSPKSDKDRSNSPKVPPLKIIIPSKGSSKASSSSGSASPESEENIRKTTMKPALPYILHASGGEGEQTGEEPMSTEAVPVTSLEPTESENADKDGASATIEPQEADSTKGEDSKDGTKEDSKDEDKREDRVPRSTRTLRSHTAKQEAQQATSTSQNGKGKASSSSSNSEMSNDSKKEEEHINVHPRKRKLRGGRHEPTEKPVQTATPPLPPLASYEKPENPYELYLDIRKQIAARRHNMFVVQPKAPNGFKDYLMMSGNYVLKGNTASRFAVPMLSPPNSVSSGPMRDLFMEQEKERYKLRLQHVVEREKLMLSNEQEVVRVHGRAARALANQSVPFSACTILKDEDIYNMYNLDAEMAADEKDKNVRSRYNGRQFLSWIQDVDDKYMKIKEALLLRHHHEAESLHAVQKMDWEFKMKELGICDYKSNPVIDDLHVPMVHVSDEFDLLPT